MANRPRSNPLPAGVSASKMMWKARCCQAAEPGPKSGLEATLATNLLLETHDQRRSDEAKGGPQLIFQVAFVGKVQQLG